MAARTARPRHAVRTAAVALIAGTLTMGAVAPALATPADAAAPFVAVDEVGPSITAYGGAVNGVWAFDLGSMDEEVTGWAYALDGGPTTAITTDEAYRARVELPGLALGAHSITFTAVDAAGNVTELTRPFTVVAPLELAFTSKPDATTTSTTATFVVAVNDGASVEYLLDLPEGAQSASPLPVEGNTFTVTGLAVGHHKVQVGASLGDAFTSIEHTWEVVAAPAPAAPAPAPAAAPALAANAVPATQIQRGIRAGASGPSVATIQRVVGAVPDGRFGPATAAAVRTFQRAHGLVPDGIVGPLTWAAIVDVANGGTGTARPATQAVPRAVIQRGVSQGARGSAVSIIQRVVGSPADGRFGPRTRAAVIAFQRANGLRPDGIVGPLTWAVITRSA